jgi:hypothetical protein
MATELPFQVAVHIGYHKTATTWFQQVVLNRHPQIVPLPRYPLPEAQLRADPLLHALVADPDATFDPAATRAAFLAQVDALPDVAGKTVVVSAERLSGHAGSGGYDAVRIADRLHATLPEAKVFWWIRDRLASIRSEYKQLVHEGWVGSVASTFDAPQSWKSVGFSPTYWDYDRLVDAYVDRFGRDAIHVMDYGRLRADREAALADLARFLDVEHWTLSADQLDKRVLPSPSDGAVRLQRMANHLRRSEFHPYPVVAIPQRVRSRWSRSWLSGSGLADGVRRVAGRRPLFDDRFGAWVAERYRGSDERLAELGIKIEPE